MKFKTRNVEIEAIKFTGFNHSEIFEWAENLSGGAPVMAGDETRMVIGTLEGEMTATPGDWIICGLEGEFYSSKPGPFEKKYEAMGKVEGE